MCGTHCRIGIVLKNPEKNLIFIVTSSVNFETFGDSFLPLENSFRLFYTVNTQNLKESGRIYKGQKRFSKGVFFLN